MRISPFVVCGLGLLDGAAFAADEPDSQPKLETVIVTAAKREEKLKDVAMSVTAVTGDDLLRRQATSFVDFANQIPGLSLQAVDAGTTRLILRGANAGSVGATVATLVDDIPFSMSGAQADGAFFGSDIDTYDLSRVEVLRGPQGTLYGATAEGGLIKYVTNLPDVTRFEANAVVGGSVVDGGSTQGMVKGMINLPFWSNKAAFRLSAVEEDQPGWIDSTARNQKNINSGSKYSVRGSVLFKPTDDFTARITLFNQRLGVHGDQAVDVVGAAANPAAPPANQFDPVHGLTNGDVWPHDISTRLTYYALNLQYSLPAVSFMSATSYGQVRQDHTSDFSNTNVIPGLTYSDLLSGAYGRPIIMALRQSETLHKFNQELRASSNPGSQLFGHGFDWQGGLFYTRETTDLYQFFDARDLANPATVLSPPALGGANIPAVYKESAVYADVVYHFSTAFDVDVGGRETHIQQQSQTTTYCCVLYGPVDTPFATLNTTENSHTWSVAPRWHINEDNLLYARVSTGYRPGGPNLPTPTLPTPPSFLSDSTRNYEVGVKSSFFDKTLNVDLTVFDIEWKDIQILSIVNTPSGPVGINGNSGEARSRGVEWNMTWSPIRGLLFGFLGEYTDAKLTADAPGLGAFSGDELPYVPKVSATFNADYRWHAFNDYSAFAGASWSYTGTSYTSFSPTSSVESHVKLPTYNTLKLNVGLENDRYNFELYATNVTNKLGITEYANNGGVNQLGQAVFIQPRTVGVQVGVKF